MAYEAYEATTDPVEPPLESEWLRNKALRRCECTDPWRLTCVNMDTGSVTVRGNEACSCGCHRSRLTDRGGR